METSNQTLPSCKICQKGTLARKHVPLFGSAGVALRYLFLVVGVLSLLGGIGLAMASSAAQRSIGTIQNRESSEADANAAAQQNRIGTMLPFNPYQAPQADIDQGNQDGQMIQMADSYEKPALIIGSILIVVGFFVGTRKWKLVCHSCGAAVDAA
jgi:hypothetical protein